jgi:uncharacterized membrane protein YsdA (DUF1294 family)
VRTYQRSPMSGAMRAFSYWLSAVLLALMAALIMEGALSLHLVPAWLISINIFTLIFYWIDKINSIWVDENERRKALNMRIPEAALLFLALAGGSPAAALAIAVLPHKTNKDWFLFCILLILVIQGIAVFLLRDELPWP